jgi:hypothetical protein
MRKSKFTESQIVATLKQVEAGDRSKTSAASWEFPTRLTTYGSPNTAVWRPQICRDRGTWKRSTASSSACMPSWRWKTMP